MKSKREMMECLDDKFDLIVARIEEAIDQNQPVDVDAYLDALTACYRAMVEVEILGQSVRAGEPQRRADRSKLSVEMDNAMQTLRDLLKP